MTFQGFAKKQATNEKRYNCVICVGVSRSRQPEAAVREAAEAMKKTSLAFVLVFVPARLDIEKTAVALGNHLPGIMVFGCTTVGQITPAGYENDALLIVAFPRAHFRVTSLLIPSDPLNTIEDIGTKAARLLSRFSSTAGWNQLALMIADGLSKQEDMIVATLGESLRPIPVFGGSAVDDRVYKKSFVLSHGKPHPNASLVLLLETDLAFEGLGFAHFEPTRVKMVITRARPAERLVLEINGAPAATEYARIVGVPEETLSPIVFAENPLLVRSGNSYHVRAIQQNLDNRALSFLSAIDDGLILTLGRGKEIIQTLNNGLATRDEFGRRPNIILGFDCFLRRLEIEHKGREAEASKVLRRHRVVGFNTYGEQHRGVHVNQTFVGVAFFEPRKVHGLD